MATAVDALEKLFDSGCDSGLEGQADGQADWEVILAAQAEQLKPLADGLGACIAKIDQLSQEIQRVKMDDRVLTDLSERCRQLSERHHEREFLNPMFLALIGIADRCRRQTASLEELWEKHTNAANKTALAAIRHILDARDADRIEIESLLANYGVESFEHLEDRFDPAFHKVVRRVKCSDPSLHGRVAQRMQPGYRRHGKVLREEYVSVYVLDETTTSTAHLTTKGD